MQATIDSEMLVTLYQSCYSHFGRVVSFTKLLSARDLEEAPLGYLSALPSEPLRRYRVGRDGVGAIRRTYARSSTSQ